MTRAQLAREADALLWAAKWWQNEDVVTGKPCRFKNIMPVIFDVAEHAETEGGLRGWLIWASAALSEASRLAEDELVNEED